MTLANIEIELYTEAGHDYVYLSNDGSSGCKYEISGATDLAEIVADYVASVYENLQEAEEYFDGEKDFE